MRRQAVRRMLRAGGFKPSGRNKPAQEYLLRTAAEAGQWPVILNAVDVLNVVSLRSGLPISLVALARAGTDAAAFATANRARQFVFNQSGQELDVEGLLSICRDEGSRTIPWARRSKTRNLPRSWSVITTSWPASSRRGLRFRWTCCVAGRTNWPRDCGAGARHARWTCVWNRRSGDLDRIGCEQAGGMNGIDRMAAVQSRPVVLLSVKPGVVNPVHLVSFSRRPIMPSKTQPGTGHSAEAPVSRGPSSVRQVSATGITN